MPWNPNQYELFKNQRSQPFYDLCSMVIPQENMSIIDLGCGTGELTSTLATRFKNCTILGIDNSPEMLAKATPQQTQHIRFDLVDQSNFVGMFDLVISNAALQWTDDHRVLFAKIWNHIKPGGQLAVQMPSNHNSPAHKAIRKVADFQPFNKVLGGWNRVSPVLSPEDYSELLYRLGAENIQVIERIYPHVLEDANAVMEWISGTALVPYLERIGEERASFVRILKSELEKAYPGSPVYYPFKRIFLHATKPT